MGDFHIDPDSIDEVRQPSRYKEPVPVRRTPAPAPRDANFLELAKHRMQDEVEHGGRQQPGTELVSRPDNVVPDDSPAARDATLQREIVRGELLQAAHSARIARAQVAMLMAVDPNKAIDAGRSGALTAYRHLRAAMRAGDIVRSGAIEAFGDAWVNGMELVEALDAHGRVDESASDLAALLRNLQRSSNYAPPPTKAGRLAIANKHAKVEATAASTVFSGWLDRSSHALEGAVEAFIKKQISTEPDWSKTSNDVKESDIFLPASRTAVEHLTQVTRLTRDDDGSLDRRVPHVADSLERFFAVGQRFVDWAIQGHAAEEAARTLVDATSSLASWAGRSPIRVQVFDGSTGNDEAAEMQQENLRDVWSAAFKQHDLALAELENSEELPHTPSWSARLFSSIVQISLATLIGGPAGAAGAFAQTLMHSSDVKKGFVGNAVESLVGSVLSELIDSKASEDTSAGTRKRFFHAQRELLTSIELRLRSSLLRAAELEARRQDNPAEYLKRLYVEMRSKLDKIEAAQRRRSVQDWATYQARAAHGMDDESGGVDMTGVGPSMDGRNPSLPLYTAPTGVLLLAMKVSRSAVWVERARVTGLTDHERKQLKGIAIGAVRMPCQFEIRKQGDDRDATVLASRNESGALWLNSSTPAGREALTHLFGGNPMYDADVMRAVTTLLRNANDYPIRNVEAY